MRGHNFEVRGCLRRRWGALTADTLGLGVPGFGRNVLAPSGLPPRRLPAADLTQAFRILTVTLVPTPRLVLVPAALAQTDPRPRTSRTGTATALWFIVVGAHGSAISQGTARGERAIVLLGRLSKPGSRPPMASLPFAEGTRQGRKLREKGEPRRRKTRVRRSSSVDTPRKEQDREENRLKEAGPRRRGRTRGQRLHSTWRSSNAHNWLSFAARSQFSHSWAAWLLSPCSFAGRRRTGQPVNASRLPCCWQCHASLLKCIWPWSCSDSDISPWVDIFRLERGPHIGLLCRRHR
jgi:hypothetical protein